MEVKVWVDGIQRVVCGASWDTTCQDVVIALAYAMGRTGRFTLKEKWRDNERPLTPAECPLQVLHKWGEYAAEVRFILCQADSASQKRASQERLVKKEMEKSASMHRIVSPQILQGSDSSVKRSLTFSGAHNQPVEETTWLNSSAPINKFRKTHQGPVPNGDMRQMSGPRWPPHSTLQARPVRGESGDSRTAAPSSLTPSEHPHHRHHSPARPQPGKGSLPTSSSEPPTSSLSPSLGRHHLGNANRPSAFQPPKTLRSRTVSPPKSSGSDGQNHLPPQPRSHLQPQPGPLTQLTPDSQSQPHSETSAAHPHSDSQPHFHHGPVQQQQPQQPHKTAHSSSSHKPYADYIPHNSPTKSVPSSAPSSHPGISNPTSSMDQKASDLSTATSEKVGPQIEEYDLDHNFPGSHKDWNHNETPANSLEYRLEEGLRSGSGVHLEGEHAKLLRLVNMQQQRLKTQESQISLVNTEISSLEEKEMEYEENLHVIMEELLLQENRQRDLESQLNDLEKVEWETVLEEEKKCEINLTLQMASCKAMILDQDQKLEDFRTKETELLNELKQEEEDMSQEREHLKEEEARAREEESRMEEEITKLQTDFAEVRKKSTECETSLVQVERELSRVEEDLEEKGQVLTKLEGDLKEENLKEFGARPVPEVDIKVKDNEKVLLKILEDSLSPHVNVAFHTEGANNPPGPALLATFATANQSGVWV